MKTSHKMVVLLAGLTLAPALSQAANPTISLAGGVLYKSDGITRLPFNSTIVLLADDNGNGFGSLTPGITWGTSDAGDKVVARFGSNDVGDADDPHGLFSQTISGISVIDVNTPTGLTAGRQLLLAWFEKPFNLSDTGPGAGVHFGTYRTDSVVDFSDISWNVPASGSKNLFFLTGLNGGSQLESSGVALQVTAGAVPEPASLAMLMVGATALVVRRRRRVQA